MKIKNIISTLLLVSILVACDENEVMPSFTTQGTATHTMADIGTSNAAPAPSEVITVQFLCVNPSADPLETITIRAKVGDGAYTEIETFNMSSEPRDETINKSFQYTAPATAATTVVFDMVITSQKKYPQVQRTQIKTK